MPITAVPAAYRSGFSKIKSLSASDFEALHLAIERAPLNGGLKELSAEILQQARIMKREDVEPILRSLFSLSVFLTDEEMPLAANLSDLSSAMRASGQAVLSLTDEEKSAFEARLEKLLSLRNVKIAAKVQHLRLDYPKTFHDALILTDLRPVFDKPDDPPVGCAVSHMLKIVFLEDGDHKEFHVMLDADDLQQMKKLIQRAEAKEVSVKSVLKSANLLDLS